MEALCHDLRIPHLLPNSLHKQLTFVGSGPLSSCKRDTIRLLNVLSSPSRVKDEKLTGFPGV